MEYIPQADGSQMPSVIVDIHKTLIQMPEDRFKGQEASVFYTATAVKHLRILDECIMKIGDCSNLNMYDALVALLREKEKLITSNINYWEAAEILSSIGLVCGARIEQDE